MLTACRAITCRIKRMCVMRHYDWLRIGDAAWKVACMLWVGTTDWTHVCGSCIHSPWLQHTSVITCQWGFYSAECGCVCVWWFMMPCLCRGIEHTTMHSATLVWVRWLCHVCAGGLVTPPCGPLHFTVSCTTSTGAFVPMSGELLIRSQHCVWLNYSTM